MTEDTAAKTKKTVRWLAVLTVAMSGFAFALVPLYDLICDITGFNGKTGGPYDFDPATVEVDANREIKVNFIANSNGGMPWEFRPIEGGVRIHPGELREVKFYVRNPTDRVMVGRAIPSIIPTSATDYFHKTECFCFEEQVLQPGEEAELPMRFLVAPELPQTIQSISLSYALFDITDMARSKPSNRQEG